VGYRKLLSGICVSFPHIRAYRLESRPQAGRNGFEKLSYRLFFAVGQHGQDGDMAIGLLRRDNGHIVPTTFLERNFVNPEDRYRVELGPVHAGAGAYVTSQRSFDSVIADLLLAAHILYGTI
jgi:hypothetical protein